MSYLQYYTGKTIIFLCSVIIGIPLGILLGVIYFFRVALSFPLDMYREGVRKFVETVTSRQEDIWENHINRMEENKKFDRN
jgi:hypothetical protein